MVVWFQNSQWAPKRLGSPSPTFAPAYLQVSAHGLNQQPAAQSAATSGGLDPQMCNLQIYQRLTACFLEKNLCISGPPLVTPTLSRGHGNSRQTLNDPRGNLCFSG